jgi:hypothetical protein
MTGSIRLHEEIAAILAASGREWMTTDEIAHKVNERDRYQKRDGSVVTAFQIHRRARNYEHLFDCNGSRVQLRGAGSRAETSGGPARGHPHLGRPAAAPDLSPRISITAGAVTADPIIARLTDRANRVAASAWPGDLAIDGAGLYTWWTDKRGATDLTDGLGLPLSEGLIYAGQTGGTTVGGVTRAATLRSRIGGNHLRGRVRGSTFRFTLAAALLRPLGLEAEGPRRLAAESEAKLSRWMREHLSVCTVLVADRILVIQLENTLLARLDPPLNLEGMQATTLRGQITRLRRQLGMA